MLDVRGRLLRHYDKFDKAGKEKEAVIVLKTIFEIDREIPKACETLGIAMPNPARVVNTVNDPALEEASKETLSLRYESYKRPHWGE